MSKTSLVWIIAALCVIIVAMGFDVYDAKQKIAKLEKEVATLHFESQCDKLFSK